MSGAGLSKTFPEAEKQYSEGGNDWDQDLTRGRDYRDEKTIEMRSLEGLETRRTGLG